MILKISVARLGLRYLSSNADTFARGLVEGNRSFLSKAITLAESSRLDHQLQFETIMSLVKKYDTQRRNNSNSSHKSLRIGLTGPPGAGKSTFIEVFGMKLISMGHRVAVISVDPSSPISGGSILGDKTRMLLLSQSPNAFVRTSPTSGILGGIAAHTTDVISLCEAANFDFILVESVGLGQSEIDLDQAVDLMLLLMPPGGGDQLQAAKKGVMEVADIILINKADGQLLPAARATCSEFTHAMQFVKRRRCDWEVPVIMVSSRTGDGISDVIDDVRRFHTQMTSDGSILKRRAKQLEFWLWTHFKRRLLLEAERNSKVRKRAEAVLPLVEKGEMSAVHASQMLIDTFCSSNLPDNNIVK